MVPTLILDLDGTVVDSVPDLAASLNRLMASRALAPFSHADVTKMVGDGAAALVARAFAARITAQDPEALPLFLADYGANAANDTRLYPGVPETLDQLNATGWRLALCTNKPEAPARTILAHLNIAHHFAAIGGGDSFSTRKPDPGHLLATLQAANGHPSHAVMCGDHHNDIEAATAAHIPAIFAAWGYGTPAMATHAAAIADRFIELSHLAERVLKGSKQGGGSAPRPR